MKKILITGANSYIGTSFEKWVSQPQYAEHYLVDTLDMRSDMWREKDFSSYDVVFHVAGIAHVSRNPKMKQLYFMVNRDLAIETAKKAKDEGVSQFIFMSSIIVYGDSKQSTFIDKETIPMPNNFYGKSKLEAENNIKMIEDINFRVAVVRAPMIYGKKSKGNYQKLSRIAKVLPIFPDINNQRSMLYIENLCEFIKLIIDNEESGIFFPQNNEYVSTKNMVKLIALVNSKNIIFTKLFNPIITPLINRVEILHKVFGNLIYDKNISIYKHNYIVRDFQESIDITEK